MNVLDIASGVCDFIRSEVVGRSGLFRTEAFDVRRRVWYTETCDCDDFGDFAPFMAWVDMEKKGKENTVWIDGQYALMRERLMQDSGFYAPYRGGEVRKSRAFPSYPLNNLDLILGFNIMAEITRRQDYRKSFLSMCDSVVEYAISRRGFVLNCMIPALKTYYPKRGYMGFKPVVSGVFIENLADAYRMTGDVRYLEAAKKMTRGFTQHPSFRESSMFPDNIYPFIYKSSRVSSLTKSNTGMTNAILRLYEVSGDDEFREAAEKALGGILKFRTEEGAFFKSYDIGKGGPLDRTVEKGDNQSAMDVLINAYLTMKDKGLLKVAAECADFWCENQEDTGLFNERKKGQDGHGICTLDSQADMSVAVAKIRELTGKGRYKEAIRKSSSGFSMFVERKGALYEAVHPLTGKPVRKDNELKMLGGALKGMMAVHTSLKGKRLLSSRKTVLLTRDR